MFREVVSNEWFTIIFVICLIILATAKLFFPSRFFDFLLTPSNSKYLKVYSKEQKFFDLFDGLLYANFAFTLSVFGFLYYKYHIETIAFNIVLFLKIAFGIAAVFLIKTLLERLVASFFDIDDLIDSYLFQKTTYKNYLGVVLLPVNILLVYSLNPSETTFIAIVSTLLLVNIIGVITSFRAHQKLIISNLFYFILYICGFEIVPYIILFKVFIDF